MMGLGVWDSLQWHYTLNPPLYLSPAASHNPEPATGTNKAYGKVITVTAETTQPVSCTHTTESNLLTVMFFTAGLWSAVPTEATGVSWGVLWWWRWGHHLFRDEVLGGVAVTSDGEATRWCWEYQVARVSRKATESSLPGPSMPNRSNLKVALKSLIMRTSSLTSRKFWGKTVEDRKASKKTTWMGFFGVSEAWMTARQ